MPKTIPKTGEKEQTHSPIGASSAERWMACPGSLILGQKVPPKPTSKYAAEGTVAHTLGEKQLQAVIDSDSNYNLWDELDRGYVQEGHEIVVSEDMLEAVDVYVKTIEDYMAEYHLSWSMDIQLEKRFVLNHIDKQAFGTCDCVIHVSMNRLIVIDYKHGKGKLVEVENNVQVQYYALGAYYSLPQDQRLDIRWIELVIVQPRARHDEGGVRTWVIEVEELLSFEKELVEAIKRVRLKHETLASGDHCTFCPALAVCPEKRRQLSEQARLDFDDVEEMPTHLPDPKKMNPERLSQLLENAEDIQEWCKAVTSYAAVIAKRGQAIPGFKLVEGKKHRKWKDPQEVEELLESEYADALYAPRKLKTPLQVEKLVGPKRQNEIAHLWEIPRGDKKLVRNSNKDSEVLPDKITDFIDE